MNFDKLLNPKPEETWYEQCPNPLCHNGWVTMGMAQAICPTCMGDGVVPHKCD